MCRQILSTTKLRRCVQVGLCRLIVTYDVTATILSRKSLPLRRRTPRGQVLLHAISHFYQVCFPSARFSHGRAKQHSRNPKDDELHVHVPGQESAQSSRHYVCFVVVKVRIPYFFKKYALNVAQSCWDHRTQWSRKIHSDQSPDRRG